MINQKHYTGATPNSESVEQIALFRWAAYAECTYPELALMYHIPNGGMRNKGVAGKLKAEGVKAGVPDIHLPVSRAGYHSLYIEMKKIGGKTNKIQENWLTQLNEQGHLAIVCYGFEDALNTIIKYLKQ